MRIVSLSPNITEILCALGLKDYLVGITNYCNYPPEVRSLPRLGNWIGDISAEKISSVGGEIAIGCMFIDPVFKEKCEAMGIEVWYYDAKSLKDIENMVLDLGKRLGREKEAHNVVGSMRRRLENIRASLGVISSTPKIYCEEFPQPPFASGNWIPDLVSICKGKTLIKSGERSRETTFEEVKDFDPDIVVLHYCNYSDTQKMKESFLSRDDGKWKSLRCVKEGNLYAVSDDLLNRPSPRAVEGAEKLRDVVLRWYESSGNKN